MLNKKCFILEDDPERIRYFRELFANVADLTIIDSCKDVDQFQPPYDAVFLDHDLGGRQLTAHEDCGTQFAELIQDKLQTSDTIAIVHSYNRAGAERMGKLLAPICTIVYAPFRGPAFDAIVTMLLDMWNSETPITAEAEGRGVTNE